MTLRKLIYILLGTLSSIWVITLVIVIVSIWDKAEYCFKKDSVCVELSSWYSRFELANVASLSLLWSLTPVVITLMMIPFCFWFFKTLKNKKTH